MSLSIEWYSSAFSPSAVFAARKDKKEEEEEEEEERAKGRKTRGDTKDATRINRVRA